MNRRSFVKKLGLLCLVPFVPTVFLSEPIPIDAPTEKFASTGEFFKAVMQAQTGGYVDPRLLPAEPVYFGGDPVFFDNRRVLTDGVRFIVK